MTRNALVVGFALFAGASGALAKDKTKEPDTGVVIQASDACGDYTGYVPNYPTCGGISDAYTNGANNPGWKPYRVKAGYTAYLCRFDGWCPFPVLEGRYVGLASDNNYYCGNTPNLRAGISANNTTYYWGYIESGNGKSETGWFDINALEPNNAVAGECYDGPAGTDFQARRDVSSCSTYTSCSMGGALGNCAAINNPNDGNSQCGGSGQGGIIRTVNTNAHLRWSPGSTANYWVTAGDQVKVLYRQGSNNSYYWAFVEVHAPNRILTPVGARGWMPASSINW